LKTLSPELVIKWNIITTPTANIPTCPMRYGKGGASDISSKVESFLASVK
jgi:hypothetical protein